MFKFFCYSLVDVDTQRIKCHARKHDDRTGLGPETFCLKFRKITFFLLSHEERKVFISRQAEIYHLPNSIGRI